MKGFLFVAAAVAALCSTVTAQFAIVHNLCRFPIYVQSFKSNNSPYGKLTTLAPRKSYTELYGENDITVFLNNQSNIRKKPLFYGYTNRPGQPLHYEFNVKYGNPFLPFRNTLVPNVEGCPFFNCPPNDGPCYDDYHGHSRGKRSVANVAVCPQPVNVTATLCAGAS